MIEERLHLPDVVGKGYGDYWRFKGRYRVCKGSRASKKSTTTAMDLIYRIMKYKKLGANALVVRKVYRTLKDSCFAQLLWAIRRLGVEREWKATYSPLELTYKPTGQKIYFRGLDDPMKIASITVERGALCFLWIEEAYEIMREADFDMLNESIRGVVPEGLFKQITLTFNPWNDRHWIKARFFDKKDPEVFAMTSTYQMNEWLDEADKQVFLDMKRNNPRRYHVAGQGNWGTVEGLVFENWKEERFSTGAILAKQKESRAIFGLDFGYIADPTALFCGIVNEKQRTLHVFDEMYEHHMTNEKIAAVIEEMGYRKEVIIADSAEPKSIDRLRDLGLGRIRRSRKGPDSVRHGIDFLQDWRIIIHPRCVNFLTEISNYSWDKNRFDKTLNKPVDDFNHLMDAMRYAMEPYSMPDLYSFN